MPARQIGRPSRTPKSSKHGISRCFHAGKNSFSSKFDLPAGPYNPPWSAVSFKVFDGEQPTREWAPVRVTASDATGNQWHPNAIRQLLSDGEIHFGFQGGLPATERAWKLEVEFTHYPGLGFPTDQILVATNAQGGVASSRIRYAPDQTWVITNVPLPAPGTITYFRLTTNRYGATLDFKGLSGPGAYMPDGGPLLDQATTAHIRLVSPVRGLKIGLLSAVDDRGRTVPQPSSGWTSDTFGFGLNPAPDAKSIHLTFVVYQNVTVEFLAAPSLP